MPRVPRIVAQSGAYFKAFQPFLNPVLQAQRVRMRRIVSPMLPIVSYRVVNTPPSRFFNEAVIITKDFVSDINRALQVTITRQQDLKKMKMMMPRVSSFVAIAKAMEAETIDIHSLASRVQSMAFNRMMALRRVFEFGTPTELAKYVVYGRRIPTGLALTQQIMRSLENIPQPDPNSFGFVIDFSAAGSLNEFLGSFFMAFGRNKAIRNEVRNLLSGIKGVGKFKITSMGIVKETKAGIRSIPTKALQRVADLVIGKYLEPALDKLFEEVVKDIFLREPSSVSRWFPARPISRKGLKDQKHSLLGMLLTGRAEFIQVESTNGWAGVFHRFETDLAPYWYVVQYGYPKNIRPRTHQVLALRDPDPEFWQKVQWFFGVPVGRYRVNKSSVSLHPAIAKKYRNKPYYEVSAGTKARVPLLLPSGRKFSMALWREERASFTPVVRAGKVVTYSLSVKPTEGLFRKEVRGQRASMFVERIIARMAQRQRMLTQAFFNAASAYLFAGTKEWEYISNMFARSGGLGG